MRKVLLPEVDRARIRVGPMASTTSFGYTGAFRIARRVRNQLYMLTIIGSDGSDWAECGLPQPAWEHVSVSCESGTPTWECMEFVRRLFWEDHETVMQLHPPLASYVNHHPHCLHMWRPIGVEIPLPPSITVGPSKEARS